MCDTCGCDQPGEAVTFRKPGDPRSGHPHDHHHHHDHDHGHHHDHDHPHDHGSRQVAVEQDVLQQNNLLAERNRGWFAAKGILALNLVSSPGSGKTTLLERTITDLGGEFALSVVEGDQQTLADLDRADVDLLFWAGNGWATWIRPQAGSPQSLIQLPQLEQIMLRVLELDETYYHGGAHLFLGAYYGSKPPLLGGNPELSRSHFERSLSISNRQFLPALVLYAQTYARMTFNQELYVSLLQEVIDFPIESQPNSGLANQVAKHNARRLLDEVDQFF